MMRHSVQLVIACLLGIASALLPQGARADLECAHLNGLSREFLRHHVSYHGLDDELESRTIDTFIRRQDPSRTLLTEPEVEQLRQDLKGVFDAVRKGRCSQITAVQKEMVRHHETAAKFVRAVVEADGYEIDKDAAVVLDPEERGYPATAAVRDDLVRRLIHFQMSNYVSNGTELDEAREKLIARYERRFKRVLETSRSEIYSGFLDSFASSLDPHSNYLSAEVLEDFRIGMSLSLEGIGVALSEQDGYAVAERIIPGGAADRHGVMKPKDKIIAVTQDGEAYDDIIDMPLRDAVALIRGKAGTTVGLTILRQGEKTEKFNIQIVRDKIDLAEQAAKLRWEEIERNGKKYKFAILDLPSFYGDSDPTKRQCTDDVARLLKEVEGGGADGLVLDLSRNGGGLLQHAVTISGFFIHLGEVVAIENSRGQRQTLSDRDDDVLYSGPMVVLVSRISASASEILAGALKDYGRAVIVGDDHTFGKGTVQTVSQLPEDRGALKITTALFFRPGGDSTQHGGVRSDVVLPSILASDDYGEKAQRYSLPPQSTSPFLGEKANSSNPGEHWEPVSPSLLALLAENSRLRVESDTAFDEIREKLAEDGESDGTVRVSDILEERAKAGEEGGDEAAADDPVDDEEEELRPQVVEALHVLTDLVAGPKTQHASRPPS